MATAVGQMEGEVAIRPRPQTRRQLRLLQVVDDLEAYDDHALMAAAQDDKAAFAELYRRHVQDVYAFARRRSASAAEAEDVTAITFERALRKLGQFRPDLGSVGGWLLRIAANEATDHARRRTRQRSDRSQAAFRSMHDGVIDAVTIEPDAQLNRALDELPARYSVVLALRYVAGLEPADVAAQLGITPSNCAVLTHRALAALRRTMERSSS